MEDRQTTTDAPAPSTGTEQVQPVGADQAAAVQSNPDTPPAQTDATSSDQSDKSQQDPQQSQDDGFDEWAAKKGIELDSENARKVAKMYRESEKRMHETARQAKELEQSTQVGQDEVAQNATPQQVEAERLRNIELKQELLEFRTAGAPEEVAEKRRYEAKMTELLNNNPRMKALLRHGYMSLNDVFTMARGSDTSRDAGVKSQGKREALENLAQKQQAAVPRGNATTPGTTPKEKPFNELSIAEMEQRLGFAQR